MRKIFTLLTMCLLASSAWAVDIVFDATVDVGTGSATAGEFTIVKDGITVHVEQGVANGQHYRFYKNKKVTISSEIGAMTTIVFDCLGENDAQYGPAGFTSEPGEYSYSGKLGTWTNSGASQVVFTATGAQVRATKITVTVGGEVGLMAPRITPASGTYYDAVEVSMTCSTPGAKIYYTTDGSNPTTSSKEYTAPFTVPFDMGETVTVKAISADDGEVSNVVTVNYVFDEIPSYGFGNMFDTPDNTNVTFSNDATVVWQSGNYLYAFDPTGAGLIYGSTGQTYQIGDIIPAGFGGKKTTYKGEPELASPTGFHASSTFVGLTPLEITAADVNHENWAKYVLLKNVTINEGGSSITDSNGNTCEMYNGTFNIPVPENLNVKHDIYAVVGVFNAYQILPISFDEAPKREGPKDVASIEELYELQRGKLGHFTTPLTVLYQNGPNLYVKDVEGTYSLVYGTVAYTEFENGDIVNDAVAAWTLYGGNKQMTPSGETFVKAGNNGKVEPEMMAIEEVMTDMVHWYLAFEDVDIEAPAGEETNYKIVDETGSMILFDKFKIMPETLPEGPYYVEGFLTVYNNELEFYPTVISGKGGPEPYPVGDVNGDYEVNIADVNCVIDVILGAREASEFEGRADVNGDGEVNIADVNVIIDIILN
jgi:hypothetical protein